MCIYFRNPLSERFPVRIFSQVGLRTDSRGRNAAHHTAASPRGTLSFSHSRHVARPPLVDLRTWCPNLIAIKPGRRSLNRTSMDVRRARGAIKDPSGAESQSFSECHDVLFRTRMFIFTERFSGTPTRNHDHHQLGGITPTGGRVKGAS